MRHDRRGTQRDTHAVFYSRIFWAHWVGEPNIGGWGRSLATWLPSGLPLTGAMSESVVLLQCFPCYQWRPWGCPDAHGLCCCLKPHWHLWALMPPGARQMWVACAATWCHVDVSDPCCCGRSCWGPCSMLLPEAMSLSVALTATREHAEVRGTCWCKIPNTQTDLSIENLFCACHLPDSFIHSQIASKCLINTKENDSNISTLITPLWPSHPTNRQSSYKEDLLVPSSIFLTSPCLRP